MKSLCKKYLLITFIFLSFWGKADDLNRFYYNIKTQIADTTRVQELINLANECRYYYPESQVGYDREALKISQKNNYSLGEGLALKGLGKYFFEKGNYDSSFYYYTKAKLVFSNLGNNKELSNVIADYCFVCINKGEYNKALEAGLTALQIAQEMEDTEELQYTYAYLGYTYYSLKNNDEATYYLNLGLKIAEKRKDNKGIARILTYTALICEEQANYIEAVQNYSKAADLLSIEGDNHSLGIAYFNRGEAFRCQEKYDRAIQEYLTSYKLVNQLNDQDGKTLLLLRIAKVYVELFKSGSNVSNANKVIKEVGYTSIDDLLSKTCKRLSINNSKNNMIVCLQILVSLKKTQKDYKEAFVLNSQLIALKDTLADLNKANILADLLVKYEMKKNNEQIELLNLINKTNEEKINTQKTQQFFFGLGALMLIVILFALRNRIKIIAKTKNEIDKTNLRLETEKKKAEQNEKFKEQFLANVSHEIRTPLNAIIGITHILIKNKHLKNQDIYLEAMRISSRNLLGLINDILDLSKLEAGKIEIENVPFQIKKLLNEVIDEINPRAEQKNNKIDLTIEKNVPDVVVGDVSMLNHILLTLARNGNSFTENGTVSLKCKLNYLNEQKALIGFIIADTGIGIINEKQSQLLNTFVKVYGAPALDYDGSGLELTIIKHMVELQGGTIELESESGKGTSFFVEIPYLIHENQSFEENIKPANHEDIPLRDISILLVEDNDFNIMVAQDELHSIIDGLKLEVAKNGKIALDKLMESEFDLVLMDLQMPEMNGYDATVAIRKLNGKVSEIPVIAMTANTLESEVEKCLECGMNDFISKPFETKILLEKIRLLTNITETTTP